MRRSGLPLWFYRVAGDSMAPTYHAGDTLLGLRWFTPRPGQVVVATRGQTRLIKRLKKIDGPSAWLEGDNPGRSTDSRHFGAVPSANLEACIIMKLG